MQLYNSKTRKIEAFHPLKEKALTIYVCGITPYDTTHLGHAFLYVFFDTALRYFKSQGIKVTYTQNVTDIDDDILKRAKKEGRDWKELGEFWTNRFLTDLKSLNVEMPTHYVKATDSIPQMIEIISSLMKKGHAYESDGTVFFSVPSFPEYGKLCKYSRDEMISLSRERGANPDDTRKKDPLDFILWQKLLPDEPFWESPWGRGRPGWHIECSAMIRETLGEQIDVHGGGFDLIYPHHESEIAQSESYTGKIPFVTSWIHVAMLMYEGEKMSKSLGNLVLVADLLKKYSPNAIRYLLLSHHYREAWEYTDEMMDKAEKTIKHIQETVGKIDTASNLDQAIMDKFKKHMEDDFAIPQVLEMLERETENGKNLSDPEMVIKKKRTIKELLEILGFVMETA